MVEGGPEIAGELLKLPFDHIFFTGSPEVGRKVLATAAETLTSTTLELGGDSPALVDAGADLEVAAERGAWGKFLNVGQSCIAPDYLLAHETVAGTLVQGLIRVVEAQYGGPRWQRHNPDYGRLIDAHSVARLRQATDLSVQAGARIEYGGNFDESGRFGSPTIVSGVNADMALMQHELFGPVLPVLTYRHLDEALDMIRRFEPPLALYLFSSDPETERRVLSETSSGGVVVGGTMIQFVHPHLPFGGVRRSGQGRYHGEYSFRTFSHERAVTRQPSVSPVRSAVSAVRPHPAALDRLGTAQTQRVSAGRPPLPSFLPQQRSGPGGRVLGGAKYEHDQFFKVAFQLATQPAAASASDNQEQGGGFTDVHVRPRTARSTIFTSSTWARCAGRRGADRYRGRRRGAERPRRLDDRGL